MSPRLKGHDGIIASDRDEYSRKSTGIQYGSGRSKDASTLYRQHIGSIIHTSVGCSRQSAVNCSVMLETRYGSCVLYEKSFPVVQCLASCGRQRRKEMTMVQLQPCGFLTKCLLPTRCRCYMMICINDSYLQLCNCFDRSKSHCKPLAGPLATDHLRREIDAEREPSASDSTTHVVHDDW